MKRVDLKKQKFEDRGMPGLVAFYGTSVPSNNCYTEQNERFLREFTHTIEKIWIENLKEETKMFVLGKHELGNWEEFSIKNLFGSFGLWDIQRKEKSLFLIKGDQKAKALQLQHWLNKSNLYLWRNKCLNVEIYQIQHFVGIFGLTGFQRKQQTESLKIE